MGIDKETERMYWNVMHALVKLPMELRVQIKNWLNNNQEVERYERKRRDE